MDESAALSDPLIEMAQRARERAYAPYSGFKVGAALLARDGTVFLGCNVENVSFGLSNCAERTAFFSATAAGYGPGDFARIAVIAHLEAPVAPCGACRQVMLELGGNKLPVTMANLDGAVQQATVGELLPSAFAGFVADA